MKDYFMNIYTSEGARDVESILKLVTLRVSTEDNDHLLRKFEVKWIRQTIFQMHPSKATIPDGLSPSFLQNF